MCFLRFSERKGVDDSDLYYFKDKGSIKITSKLEALGRTLLSGAIGWILTKFAYFTSISGPHVAPKENSLKKIYGSEFLQSSFTFVIYLLKEVCRKIVRNPFCGQNSIWGYNRDWLLIIKWIRGLSHGSLIDFVKLREPKYLTTRKRAWKVLASDKIVASGKEMSSK